jgi:hypothetical protein
MVDLITRHQSLATNDVLANLAMPLTINYYSPDIEMEPN